MPSLMTIPTGKWDEYRETTELNGVKVMRWPSPYPDPHPNPDPNPNPNANPNPNPKPKPEPEP